MRALSTRNDEPGRRRRPYDKGRDGFVMGEGAGMLVLESAEHAAARGARVYAEVAGAGMTADGHHIAQPDPEGRGAAPAMRQALADAGLAPADIVHVNAHATSTPQGDVAEAAGHPGRPGSAADDVAVSGTKSMTGHLLGGAGAVESVSTVLAAPPPPRPAHGEPGRSRRRDRPRRRRRRAAAAAAPAPIAALNNSFGFGGHDVALVFRSV